MHSNNVVVVLVDDKKKPLREYESEKTKVGRSCDVYLPFNSEYKFLIKNNNNCRVRVEIEIDGSLVSGGGLVIDQNSQDYIERFVDTDRKFKFVKATDEAVADPSNPENGGIRVKVYREYQVPVMKYLMAPTPRVDFNPWSNGLLRSYSVPVSDYSSQVILCSSAIEKGATVEGSKSSQTFASTFWSGDDHGSLTEFTFNLKPVSNPKSPITSTFIRKSARTPIEVLRDGFNKEFASLSFKDVTMTEIALGLFRVKFSVTIKDGEIQSVVDYSREEWENPAFVEDTLKKVIQCFRESLSRV